MLSALASALSYEFFQRALLVSLILGIICSLASFFVVTKQLAFIGSGIAHSAFGGIALGLVAGINPTLTGGLFAVFAAAVSGWLSQKGHIHEDTAIGILFSASMALGIALLGFYHGYVDVFGYLFGNILAVSKTDLYLVVAVATLAVSFFALFFRYLLAWCFDPEQAEACGLPSRFLHFSLLIVLAICVIVAVKIAGIILASALLVLPAATGRQLAPTYQKMILYSVLAGVGANLIGLWLSFAFNLASGASMVLAGSAGFALSLVWSHTRSQRSSAGDKL
ncbi:MAG: metal ABC transporter permease [Clostridia bacterium]|nr:metal ABC transporter permease [Clostridia bacterium]